MVGRDTLIKEGKTKDQWVLRPSILQKNFWFTVLGFSSFDKDNRLLGILHGEHSKKIGRLCNPHPFNYRTR
ncbi:24872_t:CDS:2 [Dentiscutata erythropus]|uniref:24872_t:CDS:1 n=1 Tax=Dentiscutata erythropus TaxID=1348616 RepID=A0A9N9B8X7_9GLOM|nr:24872_t:CDS:2 [Dentiscutata erythropus]